mgnify:CR=1 FL=1
MLEVDYRNARAACPRGDADGGGDPSQSTAPLQIGTPPSAILRGFAIGGSATLRVRQVS